VLPAPEDVPYYRICADEYLFNLAPVCGLVKRIEEPQGLYRVHRQNNYSAKTFQEGLRFELSGYDDQCRVMKDFLRNMDIHADVELWKRQSWFHRLREAIDDISSVVPSGDTLVLVDENKWAALELAGRRCVSFMERNGQYWGAPSDDTTAIKELQRLRQSGASFIVFGWPAFWWFDRYSKLHRFLRSQFRCVLENERTVVFDLRSRGADARRLREIR